METTQTMNTLLQVALFLAGLGVLYVGAETMLRGSVRLARSFGISPLVIGLTLVSFGTSAPELSLDLTAAFKGKTELAFGDLVGSNIANIGLITGLAALIRPLRIHMRLLRVEGPLVIVVSLALWGLSADGELGRGDGLLLLLGFIVFLVVTLRSVRKEPPSVQQELERAAGEGGSRSRNMGLVVVGLAALVVGAQLMVHAAVLMARQFGMSELVIGLTIVAVGTSLPELATSVAGALRGEADIVVGNVVGSNIFNLLCVMGLVALVQPLPVASRSLQFDVPVMAGFAIGLLPIMWRGSVIARWEGAILLIGYAAFLIGQLASH